MIEEFRKCDKCGRVESTEFTTDKGNRFWCRKCEFEFLDHFLQLQKNTITNRIQDYTCILCRDKIKGINRAIYFCDNCIPKVEIKLKEFRASLKEDGLL